MRFARAIIFFTALLFLVSCSETEKTENIKTEKQKANEQIIEDPYILDGPGMVYVDSEYRTEYANCLPFDDVEALPHFAIAYLGNGSLGEMNIEIYANTIFSTLDKERVDKIPKYEYEGEDWYLVIPRYRDLCSLKKGEEEHHASYQGEAFVVRCNGDVVVNTFDAKEINYTLAVDENGKLLNTGEEVWDITNINEILEQTSGE